MQGLTPSGLAMPGQGVAQLLEQFEGQRPIEVAEAIRELPDKRRYEVVNALDDERLADVLQELPEDEQADVLRQLETERAADVLEAMDPDDAADLLGTMTPADAELFLRRMDPEDSEDVRRLLSHSPDTAGGLMTSEPVVLAPDTTVAEALARVRDPDLTPALASLVFVVRPPTATPTGRYLGCVHLQRLLREPPAALVSGILDTDLPSLSPRTRWRRSPATSLPTIWSAVRWSTRRTTCWARCPSTTCSTICCPTTGGSARNPNCSAPKG